VLPPGFTDSLVTSLSVPTALAFTPDGRLLLTTQSGTLRVYSGGALLGPPALDLAAWVCTNSERGLLGVSVDPAFATNNFIYLYYTRRTGSTCSNGNKVNRVSRFVLPGSNSIDPASEVVLVDNIPSPGGTHNGGDLHFGKDDNLYIAIGDGGCDYLNTSNCGAANDAARDQNVLLGKILRITRDGGIPPDNPFQGSNSARCNGTGITDPGKTCRETFAWGLRNPFRIAFDPNATGTRFHVNDVGQNTWEEIDLGQSGADYGWSIREGPCVKGSTSNCGPPPAGMTNPIHWYGHASGCSAITGGAFVPSGIWPADYDGDYLYADYVCGKIFRVDASGGGGSPATEFVTALGSDSAVAMVFGPLGSSQALYYTTYAGGGQVRRIAFVGTANGAPTAAATANPTSGPAPLTVQFNGGGSSDPDGDALSYAWDLDGDGAFDDSTSVSPSFTYAQGGSYTAGLRVNDGRGGTDTDSVVISVGNTAPVPTIEVPAADARFRAGETVTLRGSATDAEDGSLPESSLRWEVLRHHGTSHTHPWLQPTSGNDIPITTPGPEDWATASTSFLEIRLTATDSQNASTTTSRRLDPRLVDLTFVTDPPGLQVLAAGETLAGPRTVTSWEGFTFPVEAPAQTDGAGRRWQFASWSDGGGATHSITTPASPATYTARFAEVPRARVGADFDGDGKTDFGVYRPSSGQWWVVGSGTPVPMRNWGVSTDVPVPADYDGDRNADAAVWRPANGTWYVLGSGTPVGPRQWGVQGDSPVPADYDGDGKADFAIFRPGTGQWFVVGSASLVPVRTWGVSTDVPVPGDYDGDGKADMAVWRPANGTWYVVGSRTPVPARQWGLRGDIPVAEDYDADGKTDFAVFRPSTGQWYVVGSSNPVPVRSWGVASDRPVAGDYDGDAKADPAVWRPGNGTWYVLGSGSASRTRQWGVSGDVPLPLPAAVRRIFFP
jgi:glucose/arabinose dehydrogenase/PKD repeat protein